jgi:D-amino-acid oxidase
MICTIIGGGVQAVSTGILLEHLGHDTRMIATDRAYLDGEDVPAVSTDYAAASIYPVQVESEYTEDELVRRARRTFRPFHRTDVPVRKHTHYYLYENADIDHVPDRMDARRVEGYSGDVPTRSGMSIQDGYVCSEYFVEMPAYMPQLFRTYRALGGETEQRTVTSDELDDLAGDVVFNCSGYGSRELFDDESMRAMKGHILQVPYDGDEPLPFSYTYTPGEHGQYAYMYPRRETVLFGGSYLEGDIVDGEWQGESPSQPMTIDDVVVPKRLYTITEDIMGEYVDISPELVDAKYGYRPYRGDGMRIERSGDVVHNYGHGGAGISMSWWSALRAVDCVDDVSEDALLEVASLVGTHR